MTMRRHIVTPGKSLFRKNGLLTPSKMQKANRLVDTASDRFLDPNDPLHSEIEDMLAGLSPKERVERLGELFPIKGIQ
jgi:hypothetical protein